MQNKDIDIVNLTHTASRHLRDILNLSIKHNRETPTLVVYDKQNGLTDILTAAYREVLPDATYINFDESNKEEVLANFAKMNAGDLVVLIQSSNFLLNEFRIRLHLFEKKIKVIEHMHLYRNTPDVWDVYIDSLSYDKDWYHNMGNGLKNILENTDILKINANDSQQNRTELVITGGVEIPKLNIGDYEGMTNVGGTFPIGEVFTEAKDFSKMSGSVMIYAFANSDFTINMHEPFRVDIQNGLVVSWGDNTPREFIDIYNLIKSYERPLIREIGFGLNRAITRERYLQDVTAFERIFGMHLSFGEKHSVYKKENITTHKTKFHVDIFPVVDQIFCDNKIIFENGKYLF